MMEMYLMGFSHGQGKMAFQPPLKCSPQGYFHLMYEIRYTCLSHLDLQKKWS